MIIDIIFLEFVRDITFGENNSPKYFFVSIYINMCIFVT